MHVKRQSAKAAIMKSIVPLLAFVNPITSTPTKLSSSASDIAQRGSTPKADSPTPRNAVYVQTFHDENNNPLSLLPLLDNPTNITHVILAALHLNDPPGNINLNDQPPNSSVFDSAWSDVKTLQSAGIKVMMMMGGAAQGSYEKLSGDEASFMSYYEPLLNNVLIPYNLDGMDLDIEEDVDVSTPLRLINQLYTDRDADFIISMAPVASALTQGGGDLSGFSYFDLDSQAVASDTGDKLVTFYNAQFYSGFGDPSTPAFYEEIISNGWDPSRIVMGVLDSGNDGNGFVPIGELQSTIESLRAQYPNFGGVDGWEYFDAGTSDSISEPWQWVETIGNSLFGPVSASKKKHKKHPAGSRRTITLPKPKAPFEDRAIEEVRALGAGHFQAVRALNVTAGDVEAAKAYFLSKV